MIRLGLIGYPLGHSLSPKLHNAALRYCDLKGEYSLIPIKPDDMQSLKREFSRVRSHEIVGLNVTIPHKQTVISFLDDLTPTAQAIGAVNTIYLRENRLVGDNTDAPGFFADLNRFWHRIQSSTENTCTGTRCKCRKSVIVLGAGGSARAVVYALLKDGWEVTVAARRIEQGQQFAELFSKYQLQIADITLSNIELSNVNLIVNTTPVGMFPDVEQSPWPEN